MSIQGLDHINIHTSRREETLRFYTKLFDFQEGFRPHFDFPGAELYAGERAVIHLVDYVAFEAQGF
jgi:catechol 2,3-dioxygenase-like lactoylglutathione lyase family enzyme